MVEGIREKIERWKVKAENFLKNNIKAFITNTNDDWFFCNIIYVGGEGIHVQNFKGNKKFEKERIFWEDIVKFEEYKEEKE